MGGWDIYCAICGGPFLRRSSETPDDFDFHFESREAQEQRQQKGRDTEQTIPEESRELDLPLDHVRWLLQMHVVGRNLATGRCYLTGDARLSGGVDGVVSVNAADGDENLPMPHEMDAWPPYTLDNTEYVDETTLNLAAYDDQEALPQFPVHLACVHVFERAHLKDLETSSDAHPEGSPAKAWLEVLVRGCETAQGGSAPCMSILRLMDYGEFGEYSGIQYWFDAGQQEVSAGQRWRPGI